MGRPGRARACRNAAAACAVVTTLFTILLPAHTALASRQPDLVPAGWPKQVMIPSIGVRAPLESVRLTGKHDEEAPFKWDDAAWYSRGTRPGAPGRAFIFGHLDSTCCPAVFWSIRDLIPGSVIQISYRDGRALTFHVVWQHTYLNNDIPMNWIFGRAKQRGLVLYTCAGIFHTDGTGYDHKLIVYARLVMPDGRLG
jgi:sortase A